MNDTPERSETFHARQLRLLGGVPLAEFEALRAELELERKRMDWLARNHLSSPVATEASEYDLRSNQWPMDEVTILAHRSDGTIHPIDGKTFRECVDNCMKGEQ